MEKTKKRIDAVRFFTRLRQLGYRSQNAVADAAGLTRSSLSRYLRGEVKMPMEAVLAIAKVLQCSPEWLIGEPELVPLQIREGNATYAVKIPISGVVPACRRDASLPSQGPLDYITVPDGIVADEALEVRNGCMSPTIREGDIVFIRKADVATPGKIYILEVLETGERTMKRCKLVKGRMAFVADNPEYSDAVYCVSEVRVLAEVTGWLHRKR
jgi:SOS-response transcriptional repressor LexA